MIRKSLDGVHRLSQKIAQLTRIHVARLALNCAIT
jgi:hypothetical protein